MSGPVEAQFRWLNGFLHVGENCGSTTHTKKDCFERPRKKGAKWTGRNLASDDYVHILA